MKNNALFHLLFLVSCTFFSLVNASIKFGSSSGKLRLHDGAQVHISSPGLLFDGTLHVEDAADITGNPLTLTSARLTTLDGDVLLVTNGRLENGVLHFDQPRGELDGQGAHINLLGMPIKLGPSTTLKLKECTIDNFNLMKVPEGAHLELDSTCLRFDADTTLQQGTISIVTPSIFVLGSQNFSIEQSGHVVVDGSVLTIETLGGKGSLLTEDELVHLSVVNSGTIRYASVQQGLLHQEVTVNNKITQVINEKNILTEKPLSGKIDLYHSVHIDPDKKIEITDHTVIDGHGATIIFSRPSGAQFVVAPGKRVRLENVELSRITALTFHLGAGSIVEVGDHVTFELADDVIFNDGKFLLNCRKSTFFVIGIHGVKTLTLEQKHGQTGPRLDLNSCRIEFENITLQGLSLMERGTDYTNIGQVCLGGATTFVFENDSCYDCIIKSVDNCFALARDALKFSGTLRFAKTGNNVVHIRSTFGQRSERPVTVTFDDQFLEIASQDGKAHLCIDDPTLRIVNSTDQSFVMGKNSFVDATFLHVSDEPIAIGSRYATFAPHLTLETDAYSTVKFDDVRLLAEAKQTRSLDEQHKSLGIQVVGHTQQKIVQPKMYDAIYYHHTQAADVRGNILVHTITDNQDAVVDRMTIHYAQPLHLTLHNGAGIILAREDVVLKKDDIILIRAGRKNRITVTDTLVIEGSLVLEPGAELEILFEGQFITPQLLFDSPGALVIPDNSVITFSGAGVVKFDQTKSIEFGGREQARSVLRFQNGAQCLIDKKDFKIHGIGTMQLCNGGVCVVKDGAQVSVGQSKKDYLAFDVHRGGCVRVGSETDDISWLSFHSGRYALDFHDAGSLIISDNGRVEINSLQQDAINFVGTLYRFSCTNQGIISISSTGKLILAENIMYSKGAHKGKPVPFTWDGRAGLMYGKGQVQWAQNKQSHTFKQLNSVNRSMHVHDLFKAFTN